MARTKKKGRHIFSSAPGNERLEKDREAVIAKAEQNNGSFKQSKKQKKMANQVTPSETPEELYAAALELVEQSQPVEAFEKARQLYQRVENSSGSQLLPALNLLGEISVELGEIAQAREYFERAVVFDPEGKIPETLGGGAEKFLWLAQLCEEGGQKSVDWFEKGVKALQNEITALESGSHPGLDEDSLLVLRMEKKRKLANALCGIAELYMTDLSWEDDAEARCENLITEAMSVEDEPSPEVLQVLASIRLSQARTEDAQAALRRSIDSWKDLQPEDPGVPDFPTLVSLARLLMEAEMNAEAMDVLNRLVQEDDQSVETWYLGGWCQFLTAEQLKAALSASNGSEQQAEQAGMVEATMKGSRHWLNTSMKLYAQLEYEDDRLLDHAKELVADLDAVLGPEDETAAEGGDEEVFEDEWEGLDEDEDEDEDMEDVQGVPLPIRNNE